MPSKIRPPAPAALPRDRLETALAAFDAYRLALVVAPAGSGKTTLLSRLAAVTDVPMAWYRAEIWDGQEAALVAHLRLALRSALGGLEGPVESVDDLLGALDSWTGERAVLVIDDLHALEGTPAEQALERLIDYAPPALTVLAGSRVQPGFNLSRLRVSGGLVEIGPDDLRFRPWEVERLFRDHYLQQVPPQELAALARRTEGWAAGLQLFHLATRSKSPDERRRILAGVASGSRLTREYLAHNVLGDLSDELRRFLVETSVLGRLSGALCDELLGQTNSRAVLEELERRSIFTTALEIDGEYRYHEVLRAHLTAMLVEERGEVAARAQHVRAGRLLEAAAAIPEALSAYSRGEDWASVERVLGRTGESLVSRPAGWLDALPPSLVRHDPWLILASARHARDEGRLTAALDAYVRAERAFGSADAAVVCRRERISLAGWLEPIPAPGSDWTGVLRAATMREPGLARRSAEALPEWHRKLVSGLALLLSGSPVPAHLQLAMSVEDEDTPPALAAAAALADGVAALLAGDPRWAERVAEAVNDAERRGIQWLARFGRAALVLGRDPGSTEAMAASAACREDGDLWGEGLIELCRAWFSPLERDAAGATQRAATIFHGLGAGTLEAWARGLAALAAATAGPDARDAALQADTFARAMGATGPRLFAFLGLQRADPDRAHEYDEIVETLRGESGLASPAGLAAHDSLIGVGEEARADAVPARPAARARRTVGRSGPVAEMEPATAEHADPLAPLAITCLGGFSLQIGERLVDLGEIKPRPRALLRFLVLQGGGWIHREVITEALWPDGDREAPAKSLHVALSALRRLLEPDHGRSSSYVVRDGDAYRLELPPGSSVDFLSLESAVAEARVARAAGDPGRVAVALRRALELYRGDLLPEDGPASWVIEPRERARGLAVQAAQWLAETSLATGDPAEATRACLAGLAVDRYSDPLWRLLVDSREAAGDHGAATRARQEYQLVLAGLGVSGRSEPEHGTGSTEGHYRKGTARSNGGSTLNGGTTNGAHRGNGTSHVNGGQRNGGPRNGGPPRPGPSQTNTPLRTADSRIDG